MSGPQRPAGPSRGGWSPLALAALVLSLDQLSKALALSQLPAGLPRPLLPGLLRLQRVSNTGAAFSLFSGNTGLLTLISGLVCAGLLIWLWRHPPRSRWQAMALGLLLGGAAGNGLDRLRLGAVVDFLEFVPFPFPIFNLADVAINLAVICLVIDLLRQPGDRAQA
ncbi:MAG: signal peptidase II [Synechococcaceae cyanobacterium]|nr:signal peptidase II [Synechococcaceae cyanobacterium]